MMGPTGLDGLGGFFASPAADSPLLDPSSYPSNFDDPAFVSAFVPSLHGQRAGEKRRRGAPHGPNEPYATACPPAAGGAGGSGNDCVHSNLFDMFPSGDSVPSARFTCRFTCPEDGCGKSFTKQKGLASHLACVHVGEKRYPCAVCGKSFVRSDHLQIHMLSHNDDRMFLCLFPGCGKSFTLRHNLASHERTHSGERPYRCPHVPCRASFMRSDHLKIHVRRRHALLDADPPLAATATAAPASAGRVRRRVPPAAVVTALAVPGEGGESVGPPQSLPGHRDIGELAHEGATSAAHPATRDLGDSNGRDFDDDGFGDVGGIDFALGPCDARLDGAYAEAGQSADCYDDGGWDIVGTCECGSFDGLCGHGASAAPETARDASPIADASSVFVAT